MKTLSETQKAVLAAVAAFSAWGLFPIYWKFFPELSGENLFFHRLFWSTLTLWGFVVAQKKTFLILDLFKDPQKRAWLTLSAILISSNWLLYMIAVTEGKIVEASLGYFLNPLVNVIIGVWFLNERMRPFQWPAFGLAFIGVVILMWNSQLQSFPWMAVALCLTFAFYGVIRKMYHVGSIEGLCFETTVVLPLFIALGWWRQLSPIDDLQLLSNTKLFVLSLSGVITCLPLVFFAYATKKLPFYQIGFIQYLSPSLKFLCGWWLYDEVMTHDRWWAFGFIWAGLFWYSLEILYSRKSLKR
jgi:chloramphenicol-sensitive protein RarD